MFVPQRHPDGVASVAFKEPEEADACIQSFNGRWFGGRQLSAQLWDGTTDYQVNSLLDVGKNIKLFVITGDVMVSSILQHRGDKSVLMLSQTDGAVRQ